MQHDPAIAIVPSHSDNRALTALFDYLCEHHAVADNPTHGVTRPLVETREGATPALGDAQARKLLDAPNEATLKGTRDRAILATLLYHGLRREELCTLRVGDMQHRQGVPHIRIEGKGSKTRFIPLAPEAQRLIAAYLDKAKHGEDTDVSLFCPVKNNTTHC